MWRVPALLVAVCLTGVATDCFAQKPAGELIASAGWVRFQIVYGRIDAAPQQPHLQKKVEATSDSDATRQTYAVDIQGSHVQVEYALTSPVELVEVKYWANGQFFLQYERFDEDLKRLVIEQKATGKIVATIDFRGVHQKLEADDLWSFALAHPQTFDTHLAPCLHIICPAMRMVDVRKRVVDELFQLASDERPCRQLVNQLVKRLGSDQFRTRLRAEQQLKTLGPGVLPLLAEISPRHLDTEQRRRIEAVRRHYQLPTPDCCERIAAWLASCEATWLCLLNDPELAHRERAFAALCRNCNAAPDTLEFRPDASSETRQAQIHKLQSQFAKTN